MDNHHDIEVLHDEVAGLRAEIESMRTTKRRSWRDHLPRRRGFRGPGAIGLVVLLLALPVAVSASHNFTDVPTSNTYHTSIARLFGARLTGGCSTTRYCPNANVTRGQMAAFLNRGLGRGTDGTFGADDWTSITLADGALVAQAAMVAGGGTGGTGQAFATGFVNAWTNEAGVCPCEVQLVLFNPSTSEVSPTVYDTIGADGAPTDDPDLSGPFWQTNVNVSHMFSIRSGTSVTYRLFAKIVPTTPPTTPDEINGFMSGWAASIQVVYVPFGSNGGNPTLPQTTGGEGPLQPRGSGD